MSADLHSRSKMRVITSKTILWPQKARGSWYERHRQDKRVMDRSLSFMCGLGLWQLLWTIEMGESVIGFGVFPKSFAG